MARCAVVLLCAVVTFGFVGDSTVHYRVTSQIFFDKELFQDGDLLFRKGKGIFSGFFSAAGKEKSSYSHVGLVSIKGNKIFVIHTEASELTGIGFAKIEPIDVFLDDDNAYYASLYRLKGNTEIYGKNAVKIAETFVKMHIPFDTAFDMKTEDKLYCTELVWLAYKKVGINIVKDLDRLEIPVFKEKFKDIISTGSLLNSGRITFVKKLKEAEI